MASQTFTVNGRKQSFTPGDRTLLGVLRDDLGLIGAHYGCGEGQCGACTVLVDGKAVRACIVEAGQAAGTRITTIEGLEERGRLHPLQQAFLDEDALQCAYCTPGMIMSGVALLSANPSPSRAQIVRHMQGNICRCGTYGRIIAAIERASANGKERANG